MVVRKKRKSRRLRGRTRTMGWGSIGQHRKSGSRGGFGAAGMHKHRWSWVVKYAPTWFGKHGFNPPQVYVEKIREINLGELSERLEEWLRQGKAVKEGDIIKVDLSSLGYNRLLGRGKVDAKLEIRVEKATKRAVEKIESKGGKVITLS